MLLLFEIFQLIMWVLLRM